MVKSQYCVILLLFLTVCGLFAQNNTQVDLIETNRIRIENLPKSSQVDSLVVNNGSFDQTVFLYALDTKSQCLDPNDEIFDKWQYSPMYEVDMYTSIGKYRIRMFLGGLALITIPNGKVGGVLFDLRPM